jgi:hypothetical protein
MENVNNQWLDLYSGVVDQKTSINPVPIPPAAGSKNDGVATLDKPRSIAANISQPENNLYTINDRDIKILRDAASPSNRIDNLDLRGVINKAEATYPGGLPVFRSEVKFLII